jgi:sugar/nucleoside kinase (ribokinase family)
MSPKYDFVTIGDVNLDYIVASNLPFPFNTLVENGIIYWEEIVEVPGGSGLNFCVFAGELGYSSLLLSNVGEDIAGSVITKWLKEKAVTLPLDWMVKSPTGKALIMRDSSDIRLLVNNKQNANHMLDLDSIEKNKDSIQSCKVLYVSGYALSEPQMPRFKATLRAMEYAKLLSSSPPIVVFDVVPHRIYEKFSFSDFQDHTQHVDILISEVATMRRFLGLGSKTEIIDVDMAKDSAQRISHIYDRMILRFGNSGCDKQILLDQRNGNFLYEETGHRIASDKRGFGDRLTLGALRDFFKVLSSG